MGCWNGTCGLSGLPIMHGDKMYVFPIVEGYRDSFCYSTALYRPTPLGFTAEYNDYGAGEECGGVGRDVLMAWIAESLVEMEVGENQYHDIAVKREGFDTDTFFEACHEKRLKFNNPMKGYEPDKPYNNVFFTMVRQDVIDDLWKNWSFDLWKPSGMKEVPEGFESDEYYVKNVTYEKLAALIPDYLEFRANGESGMLAELEKIKTTNDLEQDALDAMCDFWIIDRFFKDDDREHMLSGKFGHALGSGYAGGGFSTIRGLNEAVAKAYLYEGGNKQVAVELLKEVLVTYMVNSFMERVRRVWLPVMHQGSQSECNEEYFLLNRICDNVIIKREGELADWDGDYNETYIAKLEAELKRAKEREEQFRLDEMSEA